MQRVDSTRGVLVTLGFYLGNRADYCSDYDRLATIIVIMLLSSDSFLTELTRLYKKATETQRGTVRLSMKKLILKQRKASAKAAAASSASSSASSSSSASANDNATTPAVLLVHARVGKRKLSCHVPAVAVIKFHKSLRSITTATMSDGLLADAEPTHVRVGRSKRARRKAVSSKATEAVAASA